MAHLRIAIIITVVYVMTMIGTSFVAAAMQVSLNNYLTIGAFIVEIISALIICNKYTRVNLYEVLKGAE